MYFYFYVYVSFPGRLAPVSLLPIFTDVANVWITTTIKHAIKLTIKLKARSMGQTAEPNVRPLGAASPSGKSI